MRRVTDCKAFENYELWLRFDDGVEGRLFLGDLLEVKAFKAWLDASRFCRVQMDAGSVVWEDGVRFNAEVLYQDLLSRSGSAEKEFSQTGFVPVAG